MLLVGEMQCPCEGSLFVQVTKKEERLTKNKDMFLVLEFTDTTGTLTLRLFNRSPLFMLASKWELGDWVEVSGSWTEDAYGVSVDNAKSEMLSPEAIEMALAGGKALIEKQKADYASIEEVVQLIKGMQPDGFYGRLCSWFLDKYGELFRRAAAARGNHHARRGGLLEHTAGMMRVAISVSGAYPEIDQPLLVAGVLFHDSGKIVENQYREKGFVMPYSERGELLGHIAMGTLLVNEGWREVANADNPKEVSTVHVNMRDHLLHLILSHHGQMEWGSPVTPKTPEAVMLHFIDNMDAKMEAVRCAFAPGAKMENNYVTDRIRMMNGRLVKRRDWYEGINDFA